MNKSDLLNRKIQHLSLEAFNPVPLVDGFGDMAFQSRNLHNAASIYDRMVGDKDCTVFLTLAGSLISSGLKRVIVELMEKNMVDAIVSTGANIVDQDFFEALGFSHYRGTQFVDDTQLRELMIDRIYDTFIDEENLRVCDDVIGQLCDTYFERRPYTSREFVEGMGRWLDENEQYAESRKGSIVHTAYKMGIPIFCPAFSDCSAGFGFVMHRHNNPTGPWVTIDTAGDFWELTQIKLANPESGLLMIGGGVPKNFIQDVVVATEVIGQDAPMHKYAIQITVADERDGALSGSTLKEACSWGKVDVVYEQMVWAEATIAFPLIAGYAYHKKNWVGRPERRFNELFAKVPA
ncbi:MAG: deoxyhypusine synthase [Bacteroidia bacterium]|nr:deoxyhypusine synthase [Bacteroidia bacterium]